VRADVIIHGHFYQPPRENPWTGQVEAEPSAAPEHDWNARITKESYRPLVPVYEYLSFDFGPTLLDWMEREAPEIHDAVIRADRADVQRIGHGNALAMPFHHIILPLASRRDKETEVRWGIADFKKRFGRDPVGFWLPETAVDRETLDVAAAEGIAFTVLAPHQVSKVPERGLPAKVELNDGRSIVVFVYNGGLSHDVAFGGLASDPNRWTDALNGTPPGAIATIAVDGETFGHHHKGGDKALATVLYRLQQSDKLKLTNFAAALAEHSPTETVKLVERTSWSCPHGVERWRSNCGCRIKQDVPPHQEWRAPLRAAISAIRASFLRPETSLMISAPALIAAPAISALRVSMEMGIFSIPRSPSNTGKMRASSVSADVPVDPGRVDSPPTSSRSAPSRSIAKACSTASWGSRNLPPSEKLSGVTFRTPITSVRSPRTSVREGRRSRNVRRFTIGWLAV